MIKRSSEMESDFKEKEQGGKGSVEIMHIFKPEELKGNAKLCAVIRIEPGCSIGYHQHTDEEEIFFIMRGEAEIIDDGEKTSLTRGDSHLLRSGSYHSIENTGKELLEVMALILGS